MQSKKTLSVRAIVFVGVFAALDIVLTRPFRVMNLPFNFGFVSIATASSFFGPVYSAFTALISDVLGFILFPQKTPYFPGYAATAVLRALVYALFFYRNKALDISSASPLRAKFKVAAVCTAASGLNVAINLFTLPLWQMITSGTQQSYWFLVIKRIPNSLLFWVIQIITLTALMRYLAPLREKYALPKK